MMHDSLLLYVACITVVHKMHKFFYFIENLFGIYRKCEPTNVYKIYGQRTNVVGQCGKKKT